MAPDFDRVARYSVADEHAFRAMVGDDMNQVLAGIEKIQTKSNTTNLLLLSNLLALIVGLSVFLLTK